MEFMASRREEVGSKMSNAESLGNVIAKNQESDRIQYAYFPLERKDLSVEWVRSKDDKEVILLFVGGEAMGEIKKDKDYHGFSYLSPGYRWRLYRAHNWAVDGFVLTLDHAKKAMLRWLRMEQDQ